MRLLALFCPARPTPVPGRPPTRAWPLALVIAAVVSSGLAPAEAQAQWKWRDKSGRTHVSDMPPPRDVPDRDIMQRPGPRNAGMGAAAIAPNPSTASNATNPQNAASVAASAPARAASSALDIEVDKRRKEEQQSKAAKAKAEEDKVAEVRRENCSRARASVVTLESGIRIARVKPDGEREVLDDAARAEELRRARAVVASDCK